VRDTRGPGRPAAVSKCLVVGCGCLIDWWLDEAAGDAHALVTVTAIEVAQRRTARISFE